MHLESVVWKDTMEHGIAELRISKPKPEPKYAGFLSSSIAKRKAQSDTLNEVSGLGLGLSAIFFYVLPFEKKRELRYSAAILVDVYNRTQTLVKKMGQMLSREDEDEQEQQQHDEQNEHPAEKPKRRQRNPAAARSRRPRGGGLAQGRTRRNRVNLEVRED